jgi:hypothetical protein
LKSELVTAVVVAAGSFEFAWKPLCEKIIGRCDGGRWT